MEFSERAQGRFESLFLDQAAGLQAFPHSVGRSAPLPVCDLIERNAGSVNADFFRRATHVSKATSYAFAAHKNEAREGEHASRCRGVFRAIEVHLRVRAVKTDNHGNGTL